MDVFVHKYGIYQPCENVADLPDLRFVLDRGIEFKLTGEQYFRRNNRISDDVCIPFIK